MKWLRAVAAVGVFLLVSWIVLTVLAIADDLGHLAARLGSDAVASHLGRLARPDMPAKVRYLSFLAATVPVFLPGIGAMLAISFVFHGRLSSLTGLSALCGLITALAVALALLLLSLVGLAPHLLWAGCLVVVPVCLLTARAWDHAARRRAAGHHPIGDG